MIQFIQNIGDYFSQHFFNEDFPKKVFDRAGFVTTQKDDDGNAVENHIGTINAKVNGLSEKYFRFKNDFLILRREKDRVKLTHDFHTEVLKVLGYLGTHNEYEYPVYLNDTEVIPVRYRFTKGDKPYLFVMEMKAMIPDGEDDVDGIYDQVYVNEEWESVFPENWSEYELKPDVINEALSELFLLPEEERPEYVIMLAGPKLFLIHYEKWKYDSFLLFDLEELFTETKVSSQRNYLSLFYALLAKKQFISDSDSILHSLEEDAHKAAYGVTQTLKNGVVYAVENLANEAIEYKLLKANGNISEQRKIVELRNDPNFARELKDECLTIVYRLLFVFYAEAREDLEILPVKDPVYQRGYSLEMLRDLEMVELKTESSRNGTFFSESLWKLFDFLHKGSPEGNGFEMKPLDSPMFDNTRLKHLQGVQFRNFVLKEIILRLSLSERTKNKSRGRISYANLGINQLGSVYESLLAYSGFFASEPLIEVKAAKDKTGKDGTFLVPESRRDEFKEDEILKDAEYPDQDKRIEAGKFVYRLNGRDRKKSASYYTPEVLTQCTVKYTLKGIIDKLKEKQKVVDGIMQGENCADELLRLKILEPAMGAAAFHNEVINQLASAYLELKENEELKAGRKRIVPGQYNDELQKVKAFIAANNVYGVDLNPTAVELGQLSLWLNCMHKDMETPFFAHRLGVGNAVVGAWLKVYDVDDVKVEYPTEGTKRQRETPIAKSWWTKAPKRLKFHKSNNQLLRTNNQIYHFLLPDKAMVASFNSKLLKDELSEVQKDAFTEWKKDFYAPLTGDEVQKVLKLSRLVDYLLDEHYQKITTISRDTASHYQLYGDDTQQLDFKNYADKERVAQSRNNRAGAYYKLRTIMDYWCALWFWDVRDVANLPTRTQWYTELTNLIGIQLSTINESSTAAEINFALQKYGADTSTLFSGNRIATVLEMHNRYRFFHNELEFIEVFKERGGFDVIVGNPPWVKYKFETLDILAEKFPELEIRDASATKVSNARDELLKKDPQLYITFWNELIEYEGLSEFSNATQNFPLLKGQQTNLYKCIVENGLNITSTVGFMGLIHPESIYDDPKGQRLRKVVYTRLKYHFHFQNKKMLFSEIKDKITYGINVYHGTSSNINFKSISNLYHPSTIYSSFSSDGKVQILGMKKKNPQNDKYEWNTDGYKNRIIEYDISQLELLKNIFNQPDKPAEVKLAAIYSKENLRVLEKLQNFKGRLEYYEKKISEGLHETNAQKSDINPNGLITEYIKFPDLEKYELIYNGPHFFVANPIYRSPQTIVNNHNDFDVIYLDEIDDNFVPRTKYVPAQDLKKYIESQGKFQNDYWIDKYKLGCSKMVDSMSERTLQTCIIPPKVSHINGLISVVLEKNEDLVELAGLTHSIILDFYLKTLNVSNLTDSRLKTFPLGLDYKYKKELLPRTLMLNCLNVFYRDLWEELYHEDFNKAEWFKKDERLSSFKNLTQKWSKDNCSLTNFYERRQALVEIDVISAMGLGFNLDDLINIFKIQFSVMEKFEDSTFYDRKGKIVFTNNSQGLNGVGVDTKTWKNIKDMKAGEVHTHVIEKSELYKGKEVQYHAPFDKCDRVEDYKRAWAHFEKVFNK